jgi:ribulose-5-phosphate 4-epimerase/fuculose-1-phosphate aldolase
MDQAVRQARIDLAAALRWADRDGLSEGVCNHFSVVVPGRDDRFLLNPNRRHWSEVTASSLVMVDDDGRLIEGDAPPEATAFYIHWRLHKGAPQARCVLHTHMPYATALAMLEEPELLPLSQSSLMFHGQVAYDGTYNGLAIDASEGDRMAAALGNRSVLFLANHGVVVTGPTVAHAFCRLYYLERACMHQVMAMSTGRRLRLVPDAMAEMTRQQIAEDEAAMATGMFDAIRRLLDRDAPDYKA